MEHRIEEELLGTKNKFLLELITYLLNNPGKRLRPLLILLSSKACGKGNPKAIPVAAAIEIIHTATLIHDDILDKANLRRGKVSINARWGDELALLAGDYLYFKAFSILSRVNEEEISEVVSATAQKICEGEVTQTCRAFDTTITEEEYLEIINLKTASFMAACCRIGSILAQTSPPVREALESFGLNFGIAFQILDDCLDLFGCSGGMGKTVGRDIQQGKLTLPLIYLQKVVEKEGNKVDIGKLFSRREEVVALLKEYGITQSCGDKINSFLDKAEQRLEILTSSPEKESLFLMLRYLKEKTQTIMLGTRWIYSSAKM